MSPAARRLLLALHNESDGSACRALRNLKHGYRMGLQAHGEDAVGKRERRRRRPVESPVRKCLEFIARVEDLLGRGGRIHRLLKLDRYSAYAGDVLIDEQQFDFP